MATITEDYVSFETAKLLKEKGFDEPCYMAYVPTHRKHIMRNDAGHSNSMHPDDYYAAPTLQMAMKWLREVYNIKIEILITGNAWFYNIVTEGINGVNKIPSPAGFTYSYEDAVEVAIKYCLENLI